jgi:2-amino-4-hydroxy-6-hydroxymethyldihydropteridine diphosphokinase
MGDVMSYIGLGSNLDDPPAQLRRASEAIAALPRTSLAAISAFYRSRPLALPGSCADAQQPDYVNAVVSVETCLSPLALLEALQAIESAQGRDRRGPRWGARTIDLDILLYGQEVLETPRLSVPHPGLAAREFVLYPLYDIEPRLVLPDGRRLKDVLDDCPLRGLQRLTSPPPVPGAVQ